MTIPSPLLEAHRLGKHYDGFTLSGVDLRVGPGEVVGFVGRNGAGKTTTIKALLGLIDPDEGDGAVLGTPIREMSRKAGTATKQCIGVVFDTLAYPDAVRVRDIAGVMRRCYRDWDDAAFDGLMRSFGIGPRMTVGELSRGMGMKLSLACALAHAPRLLVLDEATAGLDPMARDEALDLLRGFVEDGSRGVLMSSHITSDLDRIADRVVCIDAGRIVFDRPKDEITDMMGVARCRARDLDSVLGSGLCDGPSGPLVLRREYGVDVAVPDRFAFAGRFPDIPCDHMTIDDYMHFVLEGGSR
ncbi:ABC transporter ATP-binding protein [Bifidobacterium phasiani]|uniref:ABC transporter ATP-binding protein n=1 Tax=Bifidobacterium phasiani TaxID=2834431 RepID=A0ABS6W8L4_9BIFI|nr:ABC transporter ATP-binding protein [Bifidobacterium phasiani]MBW3082843.1 ABC transporter ATP-binding protein [Bifidobacterium phasiani]